MEVRETLEKNRLIPVVKISDPEKVVPLAKALQDGGIHAIEITFRTKEAAEAIKICRKECPQMVLGAGTVVNHRQVDDALEAGASFLVSPGFNPSVVRYAGEKGVPHIPGTITPGEMEQAMEMGLSIVKFFPAENAGGIGFIKSVGAVYKDLKIMPTGGIKLANIRSYLELPNVIACGGSWVVKGEWIESDDFEKVRAASSEATALIAQINKKQ